MESFFQSAGIWLDDEDAFDMSVAVGNQKFKCIRCILCNKCSFFENLCFSTKQKKYSLGLEADEYPKHMYVDLADFPGGEATFERILSFCHGRKIPVAADKHFLYLHHASKFLGMRKGVNSLEEQCESFWKDGILSSWDAILEVLGILHEESLVLPKYQIELYSQKCWEELGPAMKNMVHTDLSLCIYKLTRISKEQLILVLDSGNWPRCTAHNMVTSFALAAQMLGVNVSTSVIDKLGLIAKSLLEAKLQEGSELPCLEIVMALKDSQPITYILILLHAFSDFVYKGSVKNVEEEVQNVKLMYLEILLADDLGISSPESALQLISDFFTQEESKEVGKSGQMLLLSYLELYKKKCSPLPFETFFQFAKTISVMFKDSHDALYDEIMSYSQDVNLCEEEKKTLASLVNSATLSSNRLEQVLAQSFPFSLKEYVFSLRKEIASLKASSICKRKRRCSTNRSPAKEHNRRESKGFSSDSYSEGDGKVLNLEDNKEIGYARKMKRLEISCSSFYISVLTVNGNCFSFPVKASDAMCTVRKKLVREMERNSIKVPHCPWYLTHQWKPMGSTSTTKENGIEMHSVLHMCLSFFK